jgi:hypothetical protein
MALARKPCARIGDKGWLHAGERAFRRGHHRAHGGQAPRRQRSLLGTVWGIMNSFSAIAQQKDTSLAVVAPGIAEALFATALGLVAAIPAVVAYNQISGSVSRSSERINLAIAALADALVQRAAVSQSEV